MAQPQVQNLEEILAQLEPAYAQSRGLYNQQLGLLPGQEAGAIQGLEAGKTNAFRDIARGANSRGLDFWGVPIEEQSRYIGEKYLPAVAGVKKNTQDQTFALQQAIAGLEGEKRLKGLDVQGGQKKQLDAYLEAERARAHEAALMRERLAAEARENAANRAASERASRAKDAKAAPPKLVRNSRGGWEVTGQDMDLAGYARATGADLITLMMQGDAMDKQAASWYLEKINKYGTRDADKYFQELQRDRPTAFYRGG